MVAKGQGGSGKKWSDPDVLYKYNNKYLGELEVDLEKGVVSQDSRVFSLPSNQKDGDAIHRARKAEEEHLKERPETEFRTSHDLGCLLKQLNRLLDKHILTGRTVWEEIVLLIGKEIYSLFMN